MTSTPAAGERPGCDCFDLTSAGFKPPLIDYFFAAAKRLATSAQFTTFQNAAM